MANENDDLEQSKAKRKHEAAIAALHSDIADTPEDEEKMKAEEVIIDMPDVSDIPGQEHIVVPQMQEMYDVTIASDDEEGVGLFGDDDEDEETEAIMGTAADVSNTEVIALEKSEHDEQADDVDSRLRRAELDDTDYEGEPLNQGSLATDVSGGDLDIPGASADDQMEAIGGEDEENNYYSLGGDSNDATEGTP
jgi:hypothetical protein